MQPGVPVSGRHCQHRKVIQNGALTQEVMYEYVTNDVPFVLARSIRDDEALPDTEMDLIKAPSQYAEMLEETERLFMLSTMLHSIEVRNMTPVGVEMVCVDINPAVVTKLSDRGSVESVGFVTDVELFLSLLV